MGHDDSVNVRLKLDSKPSADAALVSNLCPALAFSADVKMSALRPCLLGGVALAVSQLGLLMWKMPIPLLVALQLVSSRKLQQPYIGLSGAGSDNIAFNIFAGVPSVDFYFSPDPKVDGVSSGPSYHTAYETLDLYQRFVDPDYVIMERCSQLVGALTLSLAEAELLPYNMADLGHALLEGFGDLQTHMEDFQMHNVSAGWLEKEIDLFVKTADVWHRWICDRKSFDAGTLRILNKRMMLVERAFIKPDGLMGNPTIRNLAFGVSIENSYKTVAFSVLRLQLYQVSRMKPGSGEAVQAWLDIRRSVNDIALAVRSARMMLDPDRVV